MNAVGLIRLLLGYADFEAQGGFTDRFINLCTQRGVCLWNIKREGDTLKASVAASDYRHLRFPARRSGMKVRLRAKRGLPFFLKKHRGRVGLLAGAVLLVAFLMLMTLPVWDIEVTGNSTVPDEKILEVFEEQGVSIGILRRSIDIEKTERTALKSLPELSWLSLNILGSTAVIEVRETEEGPPMLDITSPCNIVALKDGVIKRAQADIGECVVAEGNPVLAGDLLISGVTANLDGSETLRHAKGTVLAQTVNVIEIPAPPQEVTRVYDCSAKYYLYFLGMRIPLSFARGEEVYTGKAFLEGGGQVMPLGIGWKTLYKYETVPATFSDEEKELLALYGLIKSERELTDAAEITAAERTFTQDGGARGVYNCVENIASERPILTENENTQ